VTSHGGSPETMQIADFRFLRTWAAGQSTI
jgi:hypothetical protein